MSKTRRRALLIAIQAGVSPVDTYFVTAVCRTATRLSETPAFTATCGSKAKVLPLTITTVSGETLGLGSLSVSTVSFSRPCVV